MATIESPHRPPRSSRSWREYRLLLGLLASTYVLDQLSKWWVVAHSDFVLGTYPPYGGLEIIPGFFSLVYAVNTGAAWGLLSGHGWLFLIVAAGALVALFVYRQALELHRPPYGLAFGLITGGIVGNATDRLFRGHVVDFLDVDLQFYRWPTFNIADSAIVVGVCWMILFSQFLDRQADPSRGPPSSP